jgi:predicted transposase/invertase (TIGR01784 family)
MKTDSIFYRIFQEYPAVFFELLGEPSEIVQHYRFTSVEVKQTAFRIDGMFVSDTVIDPTYFIEVQFQKDNRFFERTISEIFLFLGQSEVISNWQFVIWVAKKNMLPSLPVKYQNIQPHISIFYLDELDKRENKSLGVRIVDLVVCDPNKASEIVPAIILEARNQADISIQRMMLDLIETILSYKFAKLSYQELTAMFGLSELRQTRVFQEALELAKEQVKQEALQEGKQVGLQEGKQVGLQEGKQVGLQEGKQVGAIEAKLAIAKNLLNLGISIEQVSVATELSLAEIERL